VKPLRLAADAVTSADITVAVQSLFVAGDVCASAAARP
jgi:hypothetical protein